MPEKHTCSLIRHGSLRRPSEQWRARQAAALHAKQQPLSMFNTAHPTQLARILEAPPLAPATSADAKQNGSAAAPHEMHQDQEQAARQEESATSVMRMPTLIGKCSLTVGQAVGDVSRAPEQAAKSGISIVEAVPLPHVVHRVERHTI